MKPKPFLLPGRWGIRLSLGLAVGLVSLGPRAGAATSSADSNQTMVDTTGNSLRSIAGRVLNAQTRAPLSGVTVTYSGSTRTTDGAGKFSFSGSSWSSGLALNAAKSGYGSGSRTLTVPAGTRDAMVQPDILLSPSGTMAVTGLRPKYEGIFPSGAAILNEYTATVDWAGRPPGSVEFRVNGTLRETVPTTTTEATAPINMAQNFVGSFTRDANKVSAVAVSSDGARSTAHIQPVAVLPMPSFLAGGVGLAFEFLQWNQPSLSWEFEFPTSSATARDVQQIPFIGKFGPDFSFDVAFDYELLTGEWGLFAGKEWDKRLHYRSGVRPNSTPLHPKFYFGNVDFKWGFGGKAEGVASLARGIELEGVGVELSAGVRAEILSFYFTDYVQPAGQGFRLLDHLKRLGIDVNNIQRVRVDGLLKAELSAMVKFPSLAFSNATLKVKPGVEAVYEPNVRVAHGRIAVGGNLAFDLQLAPRFGMEEITGSIYMEVYFDAWGADPYEAKFIILSGTIYQRPPGSMALGIAKGQVVNPLLGAQEWVVYRVVDDGKSAPSRKNRAVGPEEFVASLQKAINAPGIAALDQFRLLGQQPVQGSVAANESGSGALQKAVQGGAKSLTSQADLTLVQNAFPASSPAMAARGSELMLLYVTDNGSSNALQFTDLKWTRWDGTNWTVPTILHTNTQAEFNPQVAYDGNGDVIAVWERVADANFNQTNLTAMAAQMEVVWSKWNRASGAWSTPVPLTANGYLDHAPLVCGPMDDGSVLATWTANTANLLMGTNGAGSQVQWAQWNPDGQTWSAPQTLLADLPYRLSQSLAGASNRAAYAWTRDLDGTLTNAAGQQVFYCQWSNGVWSAATQFTTNTLGNRNVRVAVSTNGQSYLVWQQGTNLVLSRNFSANPTLARTDSQTAGFADYAMTIGPAGNLVLLWQEMSANGSDAHYAVYDPASDTWGKDDLLCSDSPLERSFAPVWDSAGNLTVAYNKVQMFSTNLTVTLEGGGTVTVSNVPQSGRVDLVVTKRALVKDLALLPGDFTVQGVNYLPGDPLTLSALVRNLGNVAVSNVVVAFWDGNPTNGGTLLTNVALPGWLEGAATNTVTALWVVPEPGTNHVLYAVADPANAVTEFNETNNVQSVSIGGVDLAVSLLNYTVETNGAVRVIAQVQNLGAPTAGTNVLALRRAASPNAPITTVAVPSLEPGRLAQLALDLPPGTQPEGEAIYTLRADESGATSDVDTNNNTSTFAVNLWLDSDGDGMPDGWELANSLNPNNGADAEQDADGDGVNNLAEYRAGTNPTSPLSYLRIQSIAAGGTNGVQITWGSVSNKLYAIQRAGALVQGGALFTNLTEHILSTPPQNSFLDPTAADSGQFFYRLKVE